MKTFTPKINGLAFFYRPASVIKNLTGLLAVIVLIIGPALNANANRIRYKHKPAKTRTSRRKPPGVPAISYLNAQNYKLGQAVGPVVPTSSNITPYSYSNYASNTILNYGSQAYGVVTNSTGDVFVAEGADVAKISANGTYTVLATGFSGTSEIALDAAGNLYVADNQAQKVFKISAGRHAVTQVGTGLTSPAGVAVDAANNVYVSENDAGDVKMIAAGTNTTTVYATGFNGPIGIALDKAGNLYVADYGNSAVKEVHVNGGGTTSLELNAFGAMYSPTHLTVDHAGNLLIVGADGADYAAPIFCKTPADLEPRFVFVSNTHTAFQISADAFGNIYAGSADGQAYVLIKYVPEGGFILNKPLPAGLSFDPFTGAISGTAQVASPSSNFTVRAYHIDDTGDYNDTTNVSVAAVTTFALSVTAPLPPSITYNTPLVFSKGKTIPFTSPVTTGGEVKGLTFHSDLTNVGSGFNKPNGVAEDAAGNIYVADRGNNLVKKIAAGSGTITNLGSGFSKPTGVAVDAAGNVYVADFGNNAVKKIPAGSNTPVTIGSGFSTPLGIAVDAAGYVYVADKGNNAIKKISPNGVTTVSLNGTYNAPSGVTVDAFGNVYVADSGSGSVILVTPAGSYHLVFFGLSVPFGVALDNAGNLYTVNEGDNSVFKININSLSVTSLGNDFRSPQGIMIDTKGNIYVADAGSNTVKLIAPFDGYFLTTPLPSGIIFDPALGLISGTPQVLSPATNYTANIYNGGGSTTATMNIKVVPNTDLSNLVLSSGTLTPVFSNNVTTYGATVTNATTSITVTPTLFDATSTVTVNGVTTASGSASRSLPLTIGQNAITTVVTGSDGLTKQTYTVNVKRMASPNAALANMTVNTGTLSPAFATGTTGYTINVPNATSSLTVTPTTADAGAYVKINGASVTSGSASAALPLVAGPNTITVLVTAADSITTDTYTITVTRAPSANAFLGFMKVTTATLSPAFAAHTFTYTSSVPNATASVMVTPTLSDTTAIVKINGNTVQTKTASGPVNLVAGANKITALVTAQDGTTTNTYTVTITRAPSSDAYLSALSLSSGTLSPAFLSSTANYTANVTNATTFITIKPTVEDTTATVKVNGTTVAPGASSGHINLNVGQNTITITGTAQDGITTSTYTVVVSRAPLANAQLANLKISSGTLTPAFAPTTGSYTASVTGSVSSITVTPTTADAGATVKVNGTTVTSGSPSGAIALSVGSNSISVAVTAQDGLTNSSYSITVTRPASANVDLSNLTISTGTLSPAFAASRTTYTVSEANTVTSVTVTPTASDAGATIKVNGVTVASGSASQSLPLVAGPNAITTVVTGSDGVTTKTYTTTVTRAPSSNAKLSALAVSGATISPAFNTNTTSYTASVANSVSSVKITPTTTEPNATVTVNGTAVASGSQSGTIALNAGSNTINTVVTAQNGTSTITYTVTITRAAAVNTNLSALSISQGTLTPAFSSARTTYTATVSNTITSMTVTPTAADANATIKVNGIAVTSGSASGSIALNVGANAINIVVTGQDGVSTGTYTVTVTRAPSSNAKLSALAVSGTTISPAFNTNTTGYTASVSNATASITVTPTATEPNATITVNGTAVTSGSASGAIALNVGDNTVTTLVTAQNGTTTATYTVTVTRAMNGANTVYEPIGVEKPGSTVQLSDEITVHQAVSPNGDGQNDVLTIDNIKAFPDNSLKIMNRNGLLIFETSGYDNSSKVFDGHSNKDGKLQQPGTYFYSLDYKVKGEVKHKTGFIVLKY